MDHYSPLRYPGGKAKVADYFKQIFKDNLLYDGVYVEPYAGGASVGLSLLFNEYASKIIINDIDEAIYAFWYAVLNHNDQLCKLIRDTPVTIKNWEKQKLIQKNKAKHSLLSLGFSTFFINRTNRSGILNAGFIGGRQQLGEWKIDARYNKTDLIGRIEKIGRYSSKIELHNKDAVKLIKGIKRKLPKKSFIYFDPPYFIKGKDLYLNYYTPDDHAEISTAIGELKTCKWIVTYDNVKPIRKLYSEYRQKKYYLNYSASEANTGEEVMIFSDNIFIAKHPILRIKR